MFLSSMNPSTRYESKQLASRCSIPAICRLCTDCLPLYFSLLTACFCFVFLSASNDSHFIGLHYKFHVTTYSNLLKRCLFFRCIKPNTQARKEIFSEKVADWSHTCAFFFIEMDDSDSMHAILLHAWSNKYNWLLLSLIL